MKKKYRFKFHYNKPMSQRTGKKVWSVHYRGKCHIVDSIDCHVHCNSKVNKTQPYVVMEGFADSLLIASAGQALIYNKND
jgi:hypothetical protein